MKLVSTLIISTVALTKAVSAQGFLPVEGQHGSLNLVNDNSDTNGMSVTIASHHNVASLAYATDRQNTRGHFQLLNNGLNFLGGGKEDKVWQVSVGRRKFDNFPVMEMSQSRIAQQKGFKVKGQYLSGPGGADDFYVCSGSGYPNGNVIAWFGDEHSRFKANSAPDCVRSKLRWTPIYY